MMNIITNTLDPDTIGLLEAILDQHFRDLEIEDWILTNQSKWHPGLVRKSEKINLIDLDGDIAKKIEDELKTKLSQIEGMSEILNATWEIGLHIGRHGSYIAWHSDDENALAMTIYLNRVWELNWGGWFLFKSDTDQLVQAILPQFNLGLVYETPLMHSVVLSNPDAPPRLSLQIFVTKAI